MRAYTCTCEPSAPPTFNFSYFFAHFNHLVDSHDIPLELIVSPWSLALQASSGSLGTSEVARGSYNLP